MGALIQQLSVPEAGTEPLQFSSKYSQDTLSQFKICYWKQNLLYWRSPHYNIVRLFFIAISALIFGSIFWNVGSKRYTILVIYSWSDLPSKYFVFLLLGDSYFLHFFFSIKTKIEQKMAWICSSSLWDMHIGNVSYVSVMWFMHMLQDASLHDKVVTELILVKNIHKIVVCLCLNTIHENLWLIQSLMLVQKLWWSRKYFVILVEKQRMSNRCLSDY